MKFEVYYPTGNEFCTNCGNKITKRFMKLNQNRWAKPKLCLNCIKEIVEQIETGKTPEPKPKTKIIYDQYHSINRNSWMR